MKSQNLTVVKYVLFLHVGNCVLNFANYMCYQCDPFW